jgi:hypothetical protein
MILQLSRVRKEMRTWTLEMTAPWNCLLLLENTSRKSLIWDTPNRMTGATWSATKEGRPTLTNLIVVTLPFSFYSSFTHHHQLWRKEPKAKRFFFFKEYKTFRPTRQVTLKIPRNHTNAYVCSIQIPRE